MKFFKFSILWVFSLVFTQVGFSQSVKNINAQFDGENVSITYDLSHSDVSQKFEIKLFSSHNNYQSPLSFLSGDVGSNITSGTQRKVIWNVRNELPSSFDGEIAVKVKAILIAPNVYKIKPLSISQFKKGSDLELQWTGGSASDRIKVNLLKNNIVQQTLIQTNNSSKYLWTIPNTSKPGNYMLQVSNVANPKVAGTSGIFKIKPKIPMLAKIGVPVLIGVLVGVLAGGGSNEPSDNGLSDLPGPISPGG